MQSSYNLEKTIANGMYKFSTNSKVEYILHFQPVDILFQNVKIPILAKYSLEFGFTSLGDNKSKQDSKIKNTIIKAIDSFFAKTEKGILFYICDSEDKRQKSREKLFLTWFDKHNEGQYVREYIEFINIDNQEQVISIIFNSKHSNRIDIIKEFYNEIPKSGILDKQ